ncbi:hypothetical protein RRG08_050092 [Elysia crispata]|uniref:Uncharacterized protein n=1 Tax=Elysia crispata TaxID=231223 RepID=A0AAE0YV01_9GAST|nr:hypothetical protein RRG08_050092 [Elysia crispata]
MYDIHKHLRQPWLSASLFTDNRHSVTDLARILYLACSLIALRSEHTVIISAQSGGNTEHLTDLSGTILSKELFWRGQKGVCLG